MTTKILHEDDSILVLHRPGGSDHTLLTFADLTMRPDGMRFWAAEPAERLELDCIGLVAKAANWYPADPMRRAAAAIDRAARPFRIGYGYSMGGYAALKYGRLLGLSRALAVAPQASIDPADLVRDRRFASHFAPGPHAGMRIRAADLPGWAAAVADPHDPEDREQLDLLPADPRLRRVSAAFAGHWAIWLLLGTEPMRAALERVRDADAPGLRALLRGRRGETGFWLRHAGGCAIGRGHEHAGEALLARAGRLGMPEPMLAEARALGLLDRAGRKEPEREALVRRAVAALPAEAKALDRAGHRLLALHHPAAAECFERALALDPLHAGAMGGFSHALHRTGRLADAAAWAERAARRRPDDAEALAWLGHALNDLGGADTPLAAELCFRAALALDRGVPHIHLGLAEALSRQRRYAEALRVAGSARRLWPRHEGLRRMRRRLWRAWTRRCWRGLLGRRRALPRVPQRLEAETVALLAGREAGLRAAGRVAEAEALAACATLR